MICQWNDLLTAAPALTLRGGSQSIPWLTKSSVGPKWSENGRTKAIQLRSWRHLLVPLAYFEAPLVHFHAHGSHFMELWRLLIVANLYINCRMERTSGSPDLHLERPLGNPWASRSYRLDPLGSILDSLWSPLLPKFFCWSTGPPFLIHWPPFLAPSASECSKVDRWECFWEPFCLLWPRWGCQWTPKGCQWTPKGCQWTPKGCH